MDKKHRVSCVSSADGQSLHRVESFDKQKPSEHFENQNEKMQLSLPGWQFVSNSKSPVWIRIVWGTVIFMGITVCLGHLFCQLRLFLSQPTMMNISILQTAEIKLPNIVLCPASLLDFKRSQLSFFNSTEFENISVRNGESQLDAMWRRIRLPKAEMVKPSCGLEWIISGQLHETCKDVPVVVEEIFTALGTCYDYHFIESLPYVGVYTLLFFRIPALKENFQVTDSKRRFEILYMIHENNAKLALYTISKNLRPSFHKRMLLSFIRSREFRYLNRRTKKCETDAGIVSDCIQRCSEAFLDKAMTCRLPFINSTKPDCQGNQIMETLATVIPMMTEKEVVQCEIQCTNPCTEVIYEIRDSTAPSTNPDYIDLMFRFEDNSREIIEEALSYEAIQFFSDIGGVFGLFIGVCILSLLEICHIVILYIIKKYWSK